MKKTLLAVVAATVFASAPSMARDSFSVEDDFDYNSVAVKVGTIDADVDGSLLGLEFSKSVAENFYFSAEIEEIELDAREDAFNTYGVMFGTKFNPHGTKLSLFGELGFESQDFGSVEIPGDLTLTHDGLGLRAGAGVKYIATPEVLLSAEADYVTGDDIRDSYTLSAGVDYAFAYDMSVGLNISHTDYTIEYHTIEDKVFEAAGTTISLVGKYTF